MAYANRVVTCTNMDGVSVRFTERAFTPFLLCSIDGVYDVENKITTSENTMNDGATYQGTVSKKRNIVLTIKDNESHVYNRNLLYALFKSKEQGTLVFEDDSNVRKTTYYVEKISSDAKPYNRTYIISLLCPDPFFYAPSDARVQMSAWNGAFQFPHQFSAYGEEFGYKSNVRIQNIVNDIAADGIGMTILLEANGTVVNPSVTRIESSETIKVGTEDKPLTMVAGDTVRITTGDNDKHVYFVHNGVEEEINQYLSEDSVFIQLMRGDNNIGYNADEGADALTVTITYRFKYEAA